MTTATSTRYTATTPACPSWCTAKWHDQEAHERSASWFTHLSDPAPAGRTVEDERLSVQVSQLQTFQEQVLKDDEEEQPAILLGGGDNSGVLLILSTKDALTLARELKAAVETARTEPQED